MRSYRFLLVALMIAGCGGAEQVAVDPPRPVRRAPPPEPPPPAPPLEVTVHHTRVGAALRLDIEVAGSASTGGGSGFEDPDRWTIEASQAEAPLARLVNGSTAVERQENDANGWDTVVKFNLTFELKDSSTVAVTLKPPGGRAPLTRTLEPGEAPEPVPGAPDPAEVAAAKEAAAKAKADKAKAKRLKKKHRKQRRSTSP